MGGEEIIRLACNKLKKRNELLTDSNIMGEIRNSFYEQTDVTLISGLKRELLQAINVIKDQGKKLDTIRGLAE